jgi:hypothetical protein
VNKVQTALDNLLRRERLRAGALFCSYWRVSRVRATQAERTLQGLQTFFAASPVDAAGALARAEAGVLELFHAVARDVPAYRAFLRAHRVDAAAVRDIAAFRSLPATTKDN